MFPDAPGILTTIHFFVKFLLFDFCCTAKSTSEPKIFWEVEEVWTSVMWSVSPLMLSD